MFCANCGKQVPDGAKFCGGCGSPVAGSPAAAAPSQPTPATTPAQPAPTARKGKALDPKDMTLYEALDVAQNATTEQIQSAIKKQRTTWSNRVSRGGTMGERAKKMVERINEAEATLLDASKRAEYDKTLVGEPAYVPEVTKPGETNWVQKVYDFFDQQDWEMAKEAADKATSQQPDNPDAWFVAASVYEAVGDDNSANRAAKQLLLLQPDHPTGYEIRGDLEYNNGSKERAKTFFEKMKQCAAKRGEDDTEHSADEKIAVCNAKLYMGDKWPALDKVYKELFDENGAIQVNSTSKQRLEWLKSEFSKMKDEITSIYSGNDNPSTFFTNCKNEDLENIQGNLKVLEDTMKERSDVYKRPLITSAIAFVVQIIAGCFGTGGLVVAFLVYLFGLMELRRQLYGFGYMERTGLSDIAHPYPGSVGSQIGWMKTFGYWLVHFILGFIIFSIQCRANGFY